MIEAFKLSKVQLALLSIYSVVAVDMFGMTLVIPVMATFAQYLGATQAMIGTLYASFSSGAFLSSLFVGSISDRFGRRTVFLYCGTGAFIAFLGSSLSTNFWQFAFWRGFAGIFTGTMGNAFAYVADVVPDNVRPVYMSYITAVMSTCLVVGPIIGGGLAIFGIRVPFYAASVIAFCGLILIYNFVKEPKDLLKNENKYKVVAQNEPKDGHYYQVGESPDDYHEEVKSQNTDEKPVVLGISPWLNLNALLVGGLSTLLNTMAFTGIAVLVPLILMEPSFGIVKHSPAVTAAESQRISLFLGYILGMFGLIQAVSMIYLFPYLNQKIGLLATGGIGALISGLSFCLLLYASKEEHVAFIYIGLALGNSLSRPVNPSYLGSIAPKGRNAEYIALSSTFSNLGMVSAAQLTKEFAKSKANAILMTGGFNIVNAAIMFLFIGINYYFCQPAPEPPKKKSDLEVFFGFGEAMKPEDFWNDVEKSLTEIIDKRHYTKAMRCKKGQILVKDLLCAALPELPDTFDDKMEALYQLYVQVGHDDWADELAGHVVSLNHHRVELGVPGTC